MREYTPLEVDNSTFSLAGNKEKIYKKLGLTLTIRTGQGRIASITAPNTYYQDDVLENMTTLLTIEIKRALKSLSIKSLASVLVVGLGNEGMTADALGVSTLKKLAITPPSAADTTRLLSLAPSVSGLTGIDSNDAVFGVVSVVKPDLVILVDTLATTDVNKLARVVQLKDSGLVPGGGVGADKPALDQAYLGVPVVSIGVPLVIYLRHVIASFVEDAPAKAKMDKSLYSLVVAPKEIDYTVEYFATIIARAINKAVDTI